MSGKTSDDSLEDVPSRYELAKAQAKTQRDIEYVKASVDRIEENIVTNQDDLTEQIEELNHQVGKMWSVYLFARWAIPLIVGSGGIVGYITFV